MSKTCCFKYQIEIPYELVNDFKQFKEIRNINKLDKASENILREIGNVIKGYLIRQEEAELEACKFNQTINCSS